MAPVAVACHMGGNAHSSERDGDSGFGNSCLGQAMARTHSAMHVNRTIIIMAVVSALPQVISHVC